MGWIFSGTTHLEEKGSFYSFPVRRGDTSDSNFDLDGFKSGEEDNGNQLMVTEM